LGREESIVLELVQIVRTQAMDVALPGLEIVIVPTILRGKAADRGSFEAVFSFVMPSSWV
jgi:hypothetical protein